jgi:hypothetical protein
MSLYAFRDYCRTMADDPDVLDGDRALWTQLAEEIDAYLDQTLDDDGDPLDLFADEPDYVPRFHGRPIEDTPPL